MTKFADYLHTLPSSPLTEAVAALYEASEGDARKYMKKVLIELGLADELRSDYGENWSEIIFNKIRDDFIHKGCDVYFTPGIARIAYGELNYDDEDEDANKLNRLRALVKFITNAHKEQFTRNLEHIDVVQSGPQKGMKVKSKPMSYQDIYEMFSSNQKEISNQARSQFGESTDNGYKIIELTDFETAHKFLPYTETDDPNTAWCYLESKWAFDSYAKKGNRLYLALAPGFETMKPGQPGYGRSMIGFDMGPVEEDGTSEMCVCNNRYNHGENLEHEKDVGSGDSAYDEIQLSKILGFPVWEKCPGFSQEELIKRGMISKKVLQKLVPSFERLVEIMQDPREFDMTYGIRVKRSNNTVCMSAVFGNSEGDIVSYCTRNSDGSLVWFDEYYTLRNQNNERVLTIIELAPSHNLVATKDGIIDGLDIDSWHGHVCPVVITCRVDGNSKKRKENLITEDGTLLSKIWFDAITTPPHESRYNTSKFMTVQMDGEDGPSFNLLNYDGELMFDAPVREIYHDQQYTHTYITTDFEKPYAQTLYRDTDLVILGKYDKITPLRNHVSICSEHDRDVMIVKKDGKFNLFRFTDMRLSPVWFDQLLNKNPLYAGSDVWMPVYKEQYGYTFIALKNMDTPIKEFFSGFQYLGRGLVMVVKKHGKYILDPAVGYYDNEGFDINSHPYLDDCDDPKWLDGLVRDGIDYSIAVKDNKPYMRGDVVPSEEIPGIKIDMSLDKIKKSEDEL